MTNNEQKMPVKTSNIKVRVLVLVVVVVLLIATGFTVWTLRERNMGVASGVSLKRTPNIESIPGIVTPSRDYVKTQEAQNILGAEIAAKQGMSSVPTVTRASYQSGEEFNVGKDNNSPECSVDELRRARLAGVKAEELRCKGCGAVALRAAGYTAGELMEAGFTASQLRDAGFSAIELRNAGFTATQLKNAGFAVCELVDAGYSAVELLDAQFTVQELQTCGMTVDALRAAGVGQAAPNKSKECNIETLKKAKQQGKTAIELKQKGCGAEAMKAAGYTAKELEDAGFSAKELKDAGFSAKELKDAGFSAKQLKDAGFDATALKEAGFTAKQLKDAGFTAGELKKAGFTAKQLKEAGFSAKELKDAGFGAKDLLDAGFTPDELKEAGFSDGDLLRAGVSPEELGIGKKAEPPIIASSEVAGVSSPNGATAEISTAPEQQPASASVVPVQQDSMVDALERLQQRQAEQLSQQERQQMLQQMSQAMSTQANDLFASWSPPATQQYTMSEEPKGQSNGGVSAGQAAQNANNIKAGSVMFAVLDTAVNSDEPSPVMATIIQGPLKGAKLLGGLQLVGQKVILSFQTISIPKMEKSISLSAVAIDPETARTAVATDVDNHYMLRYGTLFASSFISGMAQAISESGSSTVITPFGISQSHDEYSTSEKVAIGMGEVGKQYSQTLKQNFNTPPTVKVASGTGLGILFMQDLSVPVETVSKT